MVARPGPGTAVEAMKQPSHHTAKGSLSVVVVGIELGEDGERHPPATPLQQRDLVVDPARSRAPATLEVEVPAARRDPPDPPSLPADDVREEVEGVGTVPPWDV
jgi:hypothetical protein